MIQLRKVRRWIPKGEEKEKSADLKLQNDVVCNSIAELFENIERYTDIIDPEEKWNIFYTLGNGDHDKKRSWQCQSVVPIDIDGMSVNEDGTFHDKYVEIACKTLKVKRDEVGLVQSGNGLHIIIGLKTKIDTPRWFDNHRMHYRVIMGNLQAALTRAGLAAKCDDSSFAPNRIMRCPHTINRKPGKKDKRVELLNRTIKPLDWDICKVADLPAVKDEDQVTNKQLQYFNVDVETVEKECRFLRHCKEHPNDLTEPAWYAMLSVTSRLKGHGEEETVGREAAHRYSRGYDGYDQYETDRKINQALAASGPRTCQNIDSVWDGCRDCEHWEKVNSPICIKGDGFIATEHCGFHMLNDSGKFVPQYEDLVRYFHRQYAYITNRESEGVYTYDGKCYKPWTHTQLRNFAHTHFRPLPMERVVKEFLAWTTRVHLIDNEWFKDTTRGRINFNNGILDLESGIILPHEPTYGFLYCLPFDYNPTATCETFDKFLIDITCEDLALAQLLLEYIGYCLCAADSYWMQKGMLLVGNGANGKSTLLQIIEALAGRPNVSFLSLGELQSETSRIQLEGKLVNISDELPSYNFKNTEMFKKLMGGSVTARRLYQQSSTLQCNTKFIFSCNDIPQTNDASKGLFRRLTIVPFNNTFDIGRNADTSIAQKMLPELPGIFNRCYQAYLQCKSRGMLTVAERAEKELDWYHSNVDRIGEWIKDNIRWNGSWDANAPYARVDEIFEAFNNDERRSEEKPTSKRIFLKRLRQVIDHYDERFGRAREGGCRPYILRGVWREDSETTADY